MLDRKIAPKVHPIGDLHLPVPVTIMLKNGIEVQVLDGGSQDVFQLSLLWRGGACEARTPYVARLAAQLMLEGAAGISGEELAEIIDFHGAVIRADASEHFTELNVVCLNSLAEGLLPVLRDVVLSPDYPEKALNVYKEREAMRFMQSMQKVAFLSQIALAPLMMGKDNPLAKTPTLDEIRSVTREELAAQHRKVIKADGCVAFLSGKITPGIQKAIIDMLESIPARGEEAKIEICRYHPEAAQEVFTAKEDALQSSVMVGFPAPLRSDPDYIPLRFATMALGGYFGSRLMKNIREDKGYTYGIRAYLLGSRDGSYVSIGAQCDNAYAEAVLEEISNELRLLATVPVEGDEMQRLCQFVSSSLVETLDTPFTIMDYYKTRKVVDMPQEYFDQQVRIAKNLSPDLIMDMAKEYLTTAEMRVSVAGKKDF